MTKRALLEAVAARHPELTRSHVRGLLEALFDGAAEGLALAGRQPLPGLGVLTVDRRPPRTARNPRTGEAVQAGPTVSVRFAADPALGLLLTGGAPDLDPPPSRDPLVAYIWRVTGECHGRRFIGRVMHDTASAIAAALGREGRCAWPGFGTFTARPSSQGHRFGFRPATALRTRLAARRA